MRTYDAIIFEIPILTVANYIARPYHSQNKDLRNVSSFHDPYSLFWKFFIVTFRPTKRINWAAINSSRATDEAEKWAGTSDIVVLDHHCKLCIL